MSQRPHSALGAGKLASGAYRVLLWMPPVLVFPAVGLLTGWFIGVSESPIVGSVITVLFGFFGVVGAALLPRHEKKSISKVLVAPSQEPGDRSVAEGGGSGDALPLETVSLLATGILLFCVACFFGVLRGIAYRNPPYPYLDQMLSRAGIDPGQVDAGERPRLDLILWSLKSKGVAVDEAVAYFRSTIKPLVESEESRELTLEEIVSSLMQLKVEKKIIADQPIDTGTFPS